MGISPNAYSVFPGVAHMIMKCLTHPNSRPELLSIKLNIDKTNIITLLSEGVYTALETLYTVRISLLKYVIAILVVVVVAVRNISRNISKIV